MLAGGGGLEVPLHAHYPVIRAMTEGAALAKWILAPDDQRERVRRSLSCPVTEEKQDQRLYTAQRTAIVLHTPPLQPVMEHVDLLEAEKSDGLLAEVRRCSDALCLDWGTVSSGAPGMETIIRRVGEAGDVPGEYAASVWKVLSGLSHPSASRAIRHAHIEELAETPEGVVSVRVTASLEQTHHGLAVAAGLFMEAVLIYQRRLIAPHPVR